jgi:hypothetical protein
MFFLPSPTTSRVNDAIAGLRKALEQLKAAKEHHSVQKVAADTRVNEAAADRDYHSSEVERATRIP